MPTPLDRANDRALVQKARVALYDQAHSLHEWSTFAASPDVRDALLKAGNRVAEIAGVLQDVEELK